MCEDTSIPKMKIVLLGQTTVGKTSIFKTFTGQDFESGSTWGHDFEEKMLEIQGKKINLVLTDTAGQELQRSDYGSILRDADGIVFVFDLTDMASYRSIEEEFIPLVKKYSEQNPKMIFVGNKLDCRGGRRCVASSEGVSLADKYDGSYLETSERLKRTIDKIFDRLAENILTADSKYHRKFKIIILGESGVGKTCFSKDYRENNEATLTFNFKSKRMLIKEEIIELEIWDIPGNRKNLTASMRMRLYKDVHGAILLYDVASRETFDELTRFWLEDMKKLCDENVVKMIIGNKIDQQETKMQAVRRTDGMKLAANCEALFHEMNMKEDLFTEHVFRDFVEEVLWSRGKGAK